MNEILIYIIVALLIGFVIGNLLAKGSLESLRTSLKDNQKALEDTKNDTSRTINQLKQEAKDIQTEKEDILRVNIRQDEAIKNFKEKLDTQKEEVENLQKKFTKEFENLANKILEEKSTKFTEQNSKNLQEILKPLQSNIDKFERKKIPMKKVINFSPFAALNTLLFSSIIKPSRVKLW